MRRLAVYLLIACVSLSINPLYSWGQTDASHTSEQARGRITGTVLCNDTQRPARGAMVIFTPLPSNEGYLPIGAPTMTRVGIDGTYTAERVSPGDYIVNVFLPGYLSPLDNPALVGAGPSAEKELRERLTKNGVASVRGGGTAQFNVMLERGGAINGRVLYSDGAPAGQVMLEVEDVKASSSSSGNTPRTFYMANATSILFPSQSAGTNDQGRFRISGLHPGTYRIAAVQATTPDVDKSQIGMMIGNGADPHALRIYSGDTLHKSQAKVYELQSGDEVSNVDITLPTDAFHVVSGTLASVDGRVLNMASITLTDTSDGSLSFHANVANDGTFLLPAVPNGNYTLAATEVRIGKMADGVPAWPVNAYARMQATAAFTDGSTNVTVKDGDVANISIALSEVAMPKTTDATAPSSSDH